MSRKKSPFPAARKRSPSPAVRRKSPSPAARRKSPSLAQYRMKLERKAPSMRAIDAAGKKKPTRGNDGKLWISQPDLRGVYRWNKFNDPFVRMV